MYYCDLFDCLQTLQTIIDLSIKIADRLESDNLLKGNESEPSPRNQKHVKRTCAGHQVRILSWLEINGFLKKLPFPHTGQCLATCERVWLESLNRRLAIFPELLFDQPRKPTLLSEFEFCGCEMVFL